MTIEQLRRFTGPGATILVGTAGADGAPACCRAFALRGNDDLTRITVYVPVATSQQTIADVATTRRVSVVAAMPIDHSGVQFKGWSEAVRLAGEDERAFVLERFEALTDVLAEIGLPKSRTAYVNRWPAFAIDVSVAEIYDQTPGPNAGARCV